MTTKTNNNLLLKKIITFVAVSMALFHIYAIQFMPFPLDKLKNFHLMFALAIFYLMQIEKREKWKFLNYLDGLILISCLLVTGYVHINYVDLTEMMGIMDTFSIILGVVLIVAIWEGTRRRWGSIIPIAVVISLFYAYFGKLFPAPFYHSGVSFDRLVGYSSMFFRGIYGSITGISASVVFILFIFVGLLDALGGSDMFMRLGKTVSAKFRSGPAQSAVVCSAFMGMISGSTAANVATTGSFTIPMMKHSGFDKGYAGAIECVASTGGQFTPPIMGAAAFLMVGLTGIPYIQVAIAAILPAVLYYFYIGLSVELRAQKDNINAGQVEKEKICIILKENFNLVLPIFVLIYFLVRQFSAGQSAIYAMYTMIALTLIKKIIYNKGDKKDIFLDVLDELKNGFKKASLQAVPLVLFFACVNIAIEMLIVTGLAQKFSHLMISLSGGSFILLLVLAAITSIIFGLGMPTPGAYILVALLGAPALVSAGSTVLAAQFFVLYYAILSCIIPPVAVAPMVACGIADTDFWDVALKALRLGLPAFILPFYFMYRPGLLIIGSDPFHILYSFICALIALASLSIALEGYIFRNLKTWERILLIISAFLLIDPGYFTTMIGLVATLTMILYLKKNNVSINSKETSEMF